MSNLNSPLLGWENGHGWERENTPTPRPVRQAKVIWDVTDSINFNPPNNNVQLGRQALREERRNSTIMFGITGRTFTALCTTILAGFLIGITARVMESGIDAAVYWRNNTFLSPLVLVSPLYAVGYFLALASFIVVVTAGVVQLLAPGAAGAGVALVIAVLNGNNIAGLFTPRVYVVKMFGTITSRMAGLALGPEAPMIHLGACVASLIFAVERRIWGDAAINEKKSERYSNWKQDLDPAFSNSSHREMISAGTAAGLAAAFGAPIGGVLFALEEACSVWSKKTAWRCLLCAAMAVFTMSQLMPSVGGGGILSLSGIYPLSSRQWLKQMPFVAAVSTGAGLLGAVFNLMRRKMQNFRAARRRHVLRLLEAGLVAAVTVVAIAFVSTFIGRCLEIPTTWHEEDVLQWTCAPGQYNDLATALLGSSPFVVRSLLGLGSESEPINNICTLRVPCYYSPISLATLCVVYLGFMVLSSGLAVPGGLFMPSIIAGGSFGAVSGMLLTALLPPSWDVQPGVYAMIGAVATMAAVFRSSISLVVIIVEGTRGIEFLPGILAATIISNFIAHWLHPDGIYESELERDGRVFFLRQEPPGALRWRTAESIMAAPVLGVQRIETVPKIVEILTSTTHNGFPVHPVVQNQEPSSSSSSSKRLDGFILRTQLLVLLQERAFCDVNGNYLSPPENVQRYERYLDSLMHAVECSCDGLGGAAELHLAVDPLGPAETKEESEMGGTTGVSAAMLPTLETLETLRTLPSLAECLQEDNIAALLQSAGTFTTSSSSMPGAAAAAAAAAIAAVDLERTQSGNGLPFGASPRSAAPTLYVNLAPFMDRGMLTVRQDTPATALHKMFVALSLRHLCVTSDTGSVVGMITRKDLDNAAGHGPWRSNKMAPSPARTGIAHSGSWLSTTLNALIYRIRTPQTASEIDGESPAYVSRPLSAPDLGEEDASGDRLSEMPVDTEIGRNGGARRHPLPSRQYSML
jgi:chloride channel 7